MYVELVKLNEENFALALRPQGERDAFQLGQFLSKLSDNHIECKVEGTTIFVKINKYGASVHLAPEVEEKLVRKSMTPDERGNLPEVKDVVSSICTCGHTWDDHNPNCSECGCNRFI